MRKYISVLLLIILGVCCCVMDAYAQTRFLKKGKWGLMDKDGKVILKAKYDSIAPFRGDYAIIMSKGNKGLVKRDGVIYLGCKYKKILFPVFTKSYGKDYFWVSKDGQVFKAESKDRYYKESFNSVFLGPDMKWYGFDRKWYEIVDPTCVRVKDWSADNPPIKRLGKGYILFEGNLYNTRGKILNNVGSYKLVKIGNAYYYSILSSGGEELALLNISKGEMWKKGKNSIWSNGDKKMMLKNNQFYQVNILDGRLGIFTLKHPEVDRFSLNVNNREVIPFKLTKTKLRTHNKGDHTLYEIALECETGLFPQNIEELIKSLKPMDIDFIISNKSGLGTSIFDKNGNEILRHKNVGNIFCKDGLLMVSIDGTEEIIDPDYDKKLLTYDAINDTHPGNLSLLDLLVCKDGKWGLYVKGIGELVPPLYDGINRLANHIYVSKDGKQGLYTKHGRKIADPVYKWIKVGNVYDKGPQFYVVKNISGEAYILGEHGQVLNSLGNIDRVDLDCSIDESWGKIYKNGKIGIINLRSYKVVVPCLYEDNIWFGGNHKFGVYRRSSGGDIVDIYNLSGKKLASRFCPSNTPYKNKQWIESQLNSSLYYGR